MLNASPQDSLLCTVCGPQETFGVTLGRWKGNCWRFLLGWGVGTGHGCCHTHAPCPSALAQPVGVGQRLGPLDLLLQVLSLLGQVCVQPLEEEHKVYLRDTFILKAGVLGAVRPCCGFWPLSADSPHPTLWFHLVLASAGHSCFFFPMAFLLPSGVNMKHKSNSLRAQFNRLPQPSGAKALY